MSVWKLKVSLSLSKKDRELLERLVKALEKISRREKI